MRIFKYARSRTVKTAPKNFKSKHLIEWRLLEHSAFNGKQYNAIDGTWTSIIDAGNPASAPDYALDMPFVITFTTGSLGTDAVMQYDNRIKVYPNPVNDYFRISNPGKLAISSVEIMDASARTVKVLKSADEYQVSDLPKGTYLLKINSNESPKITKLIKL